MLNRVLTLMGRVFKLSPEKLSVDSSVDNVPGWDSLAHMNLVVALEDEFGVTLTADEVLTLESVEIVIAILREKGISD